MCGNGQLGTTAFPVPIAQAATWDPALERSFGRALGLEAWQKGIDVVLAPNVNIARVPENGRNFEAFGEDPFLSGQTAAAAIEGIQQNPVIATVKHFAVNSQETNRYYVSSNVDDRTLHEIYLPPFETAVRQAGVGAVMCAYGLVNARVRVRGPGAAQDGAAGRVRLPRPRHVGLGRDVVDGSVGERRPRRRDARRQVLRRPRSRTRSPRARSRRRRSTKWRATSS